MALPIWGLYMKANYENKDLAVSDKDFQKPDDMTIILDCDKFIIETPEATDDNGGNLEDLDF